MGSMNRPMSVAVVGAGAVGMYYGAQLVRAGWRVKFLLRADYDVVSRQGMVVESVQGDFFLPAVEAYRSAEEMGEVDLVIVAWKATSNDRFAEVLSPLVGEKTKILTLQNGMGNVECLAELFGVERVWGGLCFVCLNRLREGLVRHTAGGRVTMGLMGGGTDEWLEALVEAWRSVGVPAELVEDLEEAQWKKLVWNIPFNGLAIAEGGVTTEDLLRMPGMEEEIAGLMAEVVAAGRARGKGLSDELIAFNLERTRPMGPYRPSSMIDYVEGREVEYEAIWGEPLRRAWAAGVEVPRMEELAQRIRERLVLRESVG